MAAAEVEIAGLTFGGLAQLERVLVSAGDRVGSRSDTGPPIVVDFSETTAAIRALQSSVDRISDLLANPTHTQGDEMARRAGMAITNGWWEQAIEDARASIDAYPYRALPYLQVALCHLNSGDSVLAFEELGRAIDFGRAADKPAAITASLLAAQMGIAAGSSIDALEAVVGGMIVGPSIDLAMIAVPLAERVLRDDPHATIRVPTRDVPSPVADELPKLRSFQLQLSLQTFFGLPARLQRIILREFRVAQDFYDVALLNPRPSLHRTGRPPIDNPEPSDLARYSLPELAAAALLMPDSTAAVSPELWPHPPGDLYRELAEAYRGRDPSNTFLEPHRQTVRRVLDASGRWPTPGEAERVLERHRATKRPKRGTPAREWDAREAEILQAIGSLKVIADSIQRQEAERESLYQQLIEDLPFGVPVDGFPADPHGFLPYEPKPVRRLEPLEGFERVADALQRALR